MGAVFEFFFLDMYQTQQRRETPPTMPPAMPPIKPAIESPPPPLDFSVVTVGASSMVTPAFAKIEEALSLVPISVSAFDLTC